MHCVLGRQFPSGDDKDHYGREDNKFSDERKSTPHGSRKEVLDQIEADVLSLPVSHGCTQQGGGDHHDSRELLAPDQAVRHAVSHEHLQQDDGHHQRQRRTGDEFQYLCDSNGKRAHFKLQCSGRIRRHRMLADPVWWLPYFVSMI